MQPDGWLVVPAADFAGKLVDFHDLARHQVMEASPFLGQCHAAVVAVEQPDTQRFFQATDLIAHAWLRQTQALGCRRQVPGPADLGEDAEPSQFQGTVSHKESFRLPSKFGHFT